MAKKTKAHKAGKTAPKKTPSREIPAEDLARVSGGYLDGAPAGHPVLTVNKVVSK